jgi:hypothetical protein
VLHRGTLQQKTRDPSVVVLSLRHTVFALAVVTSLGCSVTVQRTVTAREAARYGDRVQIVSIEEAGGGGVARNHGITVASDESYWIEFASGKAQKLHPNDRVEVKGRFRRNECVPGGGVVIPHAHPGIIIAGAVLIIGGIATLAGAVYGFAQVPRESASWFDGVNRSFSLLGYVLMFVGGVALTGGGTAITVVGARSVRLEDVPCTGVTSIR